MKWVVLKFGGTSVSSASTWKVICDRTRDLLEKDPEVGVWIVVSAVSQVTNRLEKIVSEIENRKAHMQWIRNRHMELADELGLELSTSETKFTVEELFKSLEQLLEGIALTGEAASSRLRARVLSYGEMLSSTIGCNVLNRELQLSEDAPDKTCCSWVDARELLVAIDRPGAAEEDRFLNADVLPRKDKPLAESKRTANHHRVVITQGFIASTAKGHQTCALGRGGSDTSGALFAALLEASKCEIWTDVHGMFTSDPRTVKKARHIRELSYREAQELAAMGAKVLHPRCLGPTSWADIPVEIHNTMDPKNNNQCTRIVSPEMLIDRDTTVMAISRRLGQVLITLSTLRMHGSSGFLSRAFQPFEQLGVSVDLIATSQYAVSMTLDYIPGGVEGETFQQLIEMLEKVAKVHVHKRCAVVSIVGRRLRTVLHLMGEAFRELAQYNVLLLSESTEDLNLSFVIEQSDDVGDNLVDELVSKLHFVLLEKNRGLPSAQASLFGSTLPELLQVAPSTPEMSPKSYALSKAIRGIESLDLNDLENVRSAVGMNNCIIDYPSVPCVVVDLDLLAQEAKNMKVFPITYSSHPAVIRTVFTMNPQIQFLIHNLEQAKTIRSLLGPNVNVSIPTHLSPLIKDTSSLPGMLVSVVGVDYKCMASEEALESSNARVVAANIIHIERTAGMKTKVFIDAFWNESENPQVRVSVSTTGEAENKEICNILACNPNAPLAVPEIILSDVLLPEIDPTASSILEFRNVFSGSVQSSSQVITEDVIYSPSL